MCMYKINMFSLNIYNVMCQLCLDKAGERKNREMEKVQLQVKQQHKTQQMQRFGIRRDQDWPGNWKIVIVIKR